ncbi:hypothetical protein U7230_06975 [Carboxydochorda subterranea]|uniref:Uncharacterized protein n=1 Tax=Carboxydichorda subterranea TaxID=3109565 RepID=A0ABZ1C0V0_9FIRM|nr:hypothetical protein [Limnochorda sp. L945t]WRP18729.1 hypothetical protein U7230_06975 [Limnochorda sp. L945t]
MMFLASCVDVPATIGVAGITLAVVGIPMLLVLRNSWPVLKDA